jgi:membrane associated rhomboid family serine protease
MLNELIQSLNLIIAQTQNNLLLLAIILLIPWTFFIIVLVNHRILLLGIIPRTIIGLRGILFAPLLHANFNHIFFNSIPLLILSDFILISGLQYYLLVTIMISFMSGLMIWCFAKPGLHVGASALITGYWGFLISNVYQQATVTTIILGILSLYYFAGLFLGIFPREKGVSWEGHLFGLISGLVSSYLLKNYPLLNYFYLYFQ